MHTFMSDGDFNNNFGYKIKDLNETDLKKFKRIKVFDNYIGIFINKLKEKERFRDSLILIVSDTGSDTKALKKLGNKNTFNYPYNDNISNIFGMIHFTGQRKPVIVNDLVFQEELFSIINNDLNELEYNFHSSLENFKIRSIDINGLKSYRLDVTNKNLYLE